MQNRSAFDRFSEELYARKNANQNISKAYDLLVRSDENINVVIEDNTLNAQEFIDVIALRRRDGYSISAGGGNLSAGNQTDLLYKNTPFKFVEEFLQNADDCIYEEKPQITINVNEDKSTIEFIYNEIGFSRADVWALTSFEASTKSDVADRLLDIPEEGVFYKEKTGRKGMGFKSVFSIAADNVIVHIRSNGFSFKLDNEIGRIVPVWEDDVQNDGFTHVIVELVNPKHSLEEVFPEFQKMFCVSDVENLFRRSPILFMHRIKEVTINRIAALGNDTFSIKLQSDGNAIYEFPFDPEGRVLSGICEDGQYYQSESIMMMIVMQNSGKNELKIPCYRKTNMVEVDGIYRNISFIAPIMKGDEAVKWSSGALFRTFPLLDETYDLPIAIDAPYELNTARKDVEFTDTRNARRLNSELSTIIFDEGGLFQNYYLDLRSITDIRIDYYLSRKENRIFASTGNIDAYGRRLLQEYVLKSIIERLPLLLSFEEDNHVSLRDAVMVDGEIFSWPDNKVFLEAALNHSQKVLVSRRYKESSIVTKYSVVTGMFPYAINEYIVYLQEKYGVESREFLKYLEDELYPYLSRNSKKLSELKAWKKLCIYTSRYFDGENTKILCESGEGSLYWRTTDRENNLSIGDYRIIDSMPAKINSIYEYVKGSDVLRIKELSQDLDSKNLNISCKRCQNWADAMRLIEAVSYYQYDVDNLYFPILKKYAVSAIVDPEKNIFRDAGVVNIIPDNDLQRLSEMLHIDVNSVFTMLKKAGLRDPNRFCKVEGNYTVLFKETISALSSGKLKNQLLHHVTTNVIDMIKKGNNEHKLNFEYSQIQEVPVPVKYIFLCHKNSIVSEAYRALCHGILYDRKVIGDMHEITTMTILLAWIGSDAGYRNNTISRRRLPIEYLTNGSLINIIRSAKENSFPNLELFTSGSFHSIPVSDVISYAQLWITGDDNPVDRVRRKQYFSGNLLGKTGWVEDSFNHVFLFCDDKGSYTESIRQFINVPDDENKKAVIAEFEGSVIDVYQKYIEPTLKANNGDHSKAYQDISDMFEELSKETVVKIIAWFRWQSYGVGTGNASRNSEKEIEDDYRENPWKFVYEFIQNVDDCAYPLNVEPNLEIKISRENGSISFEYNEVGFSLCHTHCWHTCFPESEVLRKILRHIHLAMFWNSRQY